jgi:hypothetical protein
MKSNNTPLNSEEPSNRGKLTYDKLLMDSAKLAEVLSLLRSPQWRALADLMEAERQEHLEALVSSRDSDTIAFHQNIAVWLQEFTTKAFDIKTGIREVGAAGPEDAPGNEYMDSDTFDDVELDSPSQ